MGPPSYIESALGLQSGDPTYVISRQRSIRARPSQCSEVTGVAPRPRY